MAYIWDRREECALKGAAVLTVAGFLSSREEPRWIYEKLTETSPDTITLKTALKSRVQHTLLFFDPTLLHFISLDTILLHFILIYLTLLYASHQ